MKEVEIQFCLSNLMLADYKTKPLVGAQFMKMRKLIMNEVNKIDWDSRSVLEYMIRYICM